MCVYSGKLYLVENTTNFSLNILYYILLRLLNKVYLQYYYALVCTFYFVISTLSLQQDLHIHGSFTNNSS